MSDWQTIDSAPKEGCFLVWLDRPLYGSHVHTMKAGNIPIICGMFAFDIGAKPIYWMPCPAPPLSTPAYSSVNAH